MDDIIKEFDSIEEMQDYLAECAANARKWAEKHHAKELISMYDYYLLYEHDLIIVGEKQSPLLLPEEYDSEEEYLWEKESAEEDLKSGYIWGKWYSVIVPEGELGTNHLSRCIPLPNDLGKALLESLFEGIENDC